MTLIYVFALDLLPLDLHAEIQVCMSLETHRDNADVPLQRILHHILYCYERVRRQNGGL